MIKHGLMLFAIFLLAGCGLFAADTEIESGEVEQVVVGSSEAVEQGSEAGDFFDRERTEESAPKEPLEEKRVDKTEEVVEIVTAETAQAQQETAQEAPKRVSPATGPRIPEAEMRKILNDELIQKGHAPQY